MQDHTNRVCGVAATCVLEGMKPAAFQPKVRMLDSEDSVEWSERDHLGDPLVRGKGPGAMHGVTRLEAWPLRGHPCEGIQRELRGSVNFLIHR